MCVQDNLLPGLDSNGVSMLDSDYRDRLELKSATDRTLGVGVVQDESTLLILTSATMMKVHMNVEKINGFDPQYASNRCARFQFSSHHLLQYWSDKPHKIYHDAGHSLWIQF